MLMLWGLEPVSAKKGDSIFGVENKNGAWIFGDIIPYFSVKNKRGVGGVSPPPQSTQNESLPLFKIQCFFMFLSFHIFL